MQRRSALRTSIIPGLAHTSATATTATAAVCMPVPDEHNNDNNTHSATNAHCDSQSSDQTRGFLGVELSRIPELRCVTCTFCDLLRVLRYDACVLVGK